MTNRTDFSIRNRIEQVETILLFYLPPLLCMATIFYLSSQSWVPIPLPAWVIIRDKVVHAIMYGILCTLWIRAFRSGARRPLPALFFVGAVLITVIYGISDEYHQSFVPGRTATIGDALADSVGAVLSALILFFSSNSESSSTPGRSDV